MSKSETNSKSEIQKPTVLVIRISDLFRISTFGFRIFSDSPLARFRPLFIIQLPHHALPGWDGARSEESTEAAHEHDAQPARSPSLSRPGTAQGGLCQRSRTHLAKAR